MVPKPSEFLAFLRPEGQAAIKELCESLESTRGLLAERAGQETTGLDPLPQDRMSLAFVQAVFKHSLSPSNVEDAIIAIKDFQFEVKYCRQTTELAFQQVWRVYDIVKSRTLQRRSSVSTISSISTQIPESSSSPQATTSFRREIIDWLKKQDVASKANSGTPNLATQTRRGGRVGTSAEGNSSAPESQSIPIRSDQELSRSRIRNFFGFSRARKGDKKMEPEADPDYMIIDPFQPWPLSSQQLSPHAPEQPAYRNRDVVSNQPPPIGTTIYGQQFLPTAAQPGEHSQWRSYPGTITDENWVENNKFSTRLEKEVLPTSQSQELPPLLETQTLLAPFSPPGAAHGVGSLGSYTFQQVPAGTQPPSSKRPLPAIPTEKSDPSMNSIARPPHIYGHASGESVQYGNDRSGVESQDNGGDGSVHSQGEGGIWVRGTFKPSKRKGRKTEALKEPTRPPIKPEDGTPFDVEDPMINVVPNTPTDQPNSMHQDSEHDQRGQNRNRSLSHSRRRGNQDPVPSKEYIQRLWGECHIAFRRTRALKEALATAAPDSLRSNPIIKARMNLRFAMFDRAVG